MFALQVFRHRNGACVSLLPACWSVEVAVCRHVGPRCWNCSYIASLPRFKSPGLCSKVGEASNGRHAPCADLPKLITPMTAKL